MDIIPKFKQPYGLWRQRGAHNIFISLAMGIKITQWPDISQLKEDNEGYHIWHYWAQSYNPENLWQITRNQIKDTLDYHLSHDGEHPIYRLLLQNKTKALDLWFKQAKYPTKAQANKDTFWHAIAWCGNHLLLNQYSHFLSLDNIDNQDKNGMTAIAISIHRCKQNDLIDNLKRWLMVGADPNIPDNYGKTTLHYIAQYGDIEAFVLLQDMGGDNKYKDHNGLKAEQILKEQLKYNILSNTISSKMHWENKYKEKLFF